MLLKALITRNSASRIAHNNWKMPLREQRTSLRRGLICPSVPSLRWAMAAVFVVFKAQ